MRVDQAQIAQQTTGDVTGDGEYRGKQRVQQFVSLNSQHWHNTKLTSIKGLIITTPTIVPMEIATIRELTAPTQKMSEANTVL